MSRWRTIVCNVLWLLSCLPAAVRFRLAARTPKRVQTERMRRLMRANARAEYGRAHSFDRVRDWDDFTNLPLTHYADLDPFISRIANGCDAALTRDPVEILQPTSGTSQASKLIPWTATVAHEFREALDTWMADLYRQHPQLLLGPQYWAISPATPPPAHGNGKTPVGFLDDAAYFGRPRRAIVNTVMAVPPELARIADMDASQYVTALFLLRARDLRLFSVWHPSFLTILLKTIRASWPRLLRDIESGGVGTASDAIPAATRKALERRLPPAPRTARALRALDPDADDLFRRCWPRLTVISCWCDGTATAADIRTLDDLFPNATIQSKGLLATEGVISIPLGPEPQHVCAATSHVLEFEDDAGTVHPLWNLRYGKPYTVILTTGGGLYRYRLRDRVGVTGFHGKTPCIRFLGRAGVVSDCVGEKLHIAHVEDVVKVLTTTHFPDAPFAMLIPVHSGGIPTYSLLVETAQTNGAMKRAARQLDEALRANYHYDHARQAGQLGTATITALAPGARVRYRRFMTARGAIAGTVKFPALSTTPGVYTALVPVAKRPIQSQCPRVTGILPVSQASGPDPRDTGWKPVPRTGAWRLFATETSDNAPGNL